MRALEDESASTLIEYTVVGALISVALIATITNIGQSAGTLLTSVGNGF